jgi:hypothetical protein
LGSKKVNLTFSPFSLFFNPPLFYGFLYYVEYLSHLFKAISLIRWNHPLLLQRLSGTQRDGAVATTDAPGGGTRGGVLGDLPDIFKKAIASR